MPKKAEPTGFAQRLKAIREAAGLTQQALADMVDYHTLTIAKLEQGVQEPTWPTVLTLAKALGVNCGAFEIEGPAEPAEKRSRGRPPKRTEGVGADAGEPSSSPAPASPAPPTPSPTTKKKGKKR
jgi:transcriptional regulator with XRE-family HTH domain